MTNTNTNTTGRNTSKDDVSSVIGGIISSVIKSETAIYAAIKYLHGRMGFEWNYRTLHSYMTAADDRSDKTTAYKMRNDWLVKSSEYNDLAKTLSTLASKRKEEPGNESVKRDFDQINKRMTAVHMKAHDAIAGAYALAALVHKNKDAVIDFADKKSRVLVSRVKDADGDPVNLDLSGETMKKEGRKLFASTQTKAKSAGAGNVAADAKAAANVIEHAEALIALAQSYINNKKSIIDNEAYGAIIGGLVVKLLVATSFDDKGNLHPVKSITEPDMIDVLTKGYAAYTAKHAKDGTNS